MPTFLTLEKFLYLEEDTQTKASEPLDKELLDPFSEPIDCYSALKAALTSLRDSRDIYSAAAINFSKAILPLLTQYTDSAQTLEPIKKLIITSRIENCITKYLNFFKTPSTRQLRFSDLGNVLYAIALYNFLTQQWHSKGMTKRQEQLCEAVCSYYHDAGGHQEFRLITVEVPEDLGARSETKSIREVISLKTADETSPATSEPLTCKEVPSSLERITRISAWLKTGIDAVNPIIETHITLKSPCTWFDYAVQNNLFEGCDPHSDTFNLELHLNTHQRVLDNLEALKSRKKAYFDAQGERGEQTTYPIPLSRLTNRPDQTMYRAILALVSSLVSSYETHKTSKEGCSPDNSALFKELLETIETAWKNFMRQSSVERNKSENRTEFYETLEQTLAQKKAAICNSQPSTFWDKIFSTLSQFFDSEKIANVAHALGIRLSAATHQLFFSSKIRALRMQCGAQTRQIESGIIQMELISVL